MTILDKSEDEKKASRCVLHDNFEKTARTRTDVPNHDIAIIIVASAFNTTGGIGPIELADAKPAEQRICQIGKIKCNLFKSCARFGAKLKCFAIS